MSDDPLVAQLRVMAPATADGSKSWFELAADALEAKDARIAEEVAENARLAEQAQYYRDEMERALYRAEELEGERDLLREMRKFANAIAQEKL